MAKYIDENVAQAIANDIQKNRVLLGAFDTVDTSNANYNLITRNTGYTQLEDLNWSHNTERNYWTSNDLAGIIKNANADSSSAIITWKCNTAKSTYADDVYVGNLGVGVGVAGTIYFKNESTDSSTKPSGVLQFELADNLKYTEKVIKGVPILNLDQNGANWLRSEWEKGLNLLNENLLSTAIANDQLICDSLPLNLPIGTYTIINYDETLSSCNISLSGGGGTFVNVAPNTSQTFTISNATNSISIRAVSITASTKGKFMLNEGDHAYPYQPYNGAIVHEKDLDTIKTDITNLQSDLSDLSNEVDDHSDILAELKSLVYDNQYPAVKNIKFNTFTALPNSIDGDSLIFGAGSDLTNIDGMSVVVNQWAKELNTSNYEDYLYASTLTYSNGVLTSTTNNSSNNVGMGQQNTMLANHKYLFIVNLLDFSNGLAVKCGYRGSAVSVLSKGLNYVILQKTAQENEFGVYSETTGISGAFISVNYLKVIDLTQFFGSNDNIPSDLLSNPSLFTSKYWKGSLDYDTGHIESAKPKAIVSRGVNVWDEEWELGTLGWDNGQNESANNLIRSKNYIKVVPNITYYVKVGVEGTVLYEYDENHNVVNRINNSSDYSFTTNSETKYIRFRSTNNGTTYNNDICINISNASINGTYYPYIAPKRYLINVGNNNSINGVNTIKDIMGVLNTDRAVGKVDLSQYQNDLEYNSGYGCWRLSNSNFTGKYLGEYVVPNIISNDGTQAVYFYGDKTNALSISNNGLILIGNGSDTTKPTCVIYFELATPYTEENPQDANFPTNIEIQKGGSLEIESDLPCDITLEVAVSKVY